MKVKKIISLLAAVSVLSASIVSVSALTIDENGMITDIPANSEISTRNPELSVVATQLTTADEVKAAGANTKYLKTTGNVNNYDVYKLEVTVSNLGELTNGYDPDYNYAYIGVTNVEVGLATTDIVGSYVTASQLSGNAGAGQGTQTGKEKYFYVNYASPSVDNPYPVFDKDNGESAEYIKNGSMTINALVSITKGTSVTISEFAPSVIYQASGGVENVKVTNVTAPESLVLGKSDVPVESIALNKDEITLDLNGTTTETLIATVLPTDATDPTVTWESDKPEIATVDGGKVTAVAVGEAKITATAGGKTATCKVTVVAPETKVDQKIIGEEGAYDGKTLIKLGKIFKNALANSFIAVKNETTGATKTSSKTIADILGGETVGETTIDVEITVGVLTDTPSDVFSFGLLN